MMIGYLQAFSQTDKLPLQHFASLAAAKGDELRFARIEGTDIEAVKQAWAKIDDLIANACAFIIPDDAVLLVEDYVRRLHVRIAEGARCLVLLNENALERQNAFLAKYDLVGTGVRIRSSVSPLIHLQRSSERFRDLRLFVGVEEVQVQQPNAIWYGGESLPILVIGSDDFMVVHREDDLPADWNARELACMAGWHGLSAGGVLATAGNYFGDPYTGATGVHWPGITANEALAVNVVTYLTEGRPSETPEDCCQRIEINLADFVFGVVKRSGDQWWVNCIPLTVRQKCAQRQEEELNRLPKEAYFDLIDLKTVMEKNWALFEPHLRRVGREGGKEKSLGWMDKLNQLRRLVGTPLKKHVSGYSFSYEEKELVKQCDALVLRLLKGTPK